MERRSRLEESRLLWQLYWNMAEEEAGSGGRLRRDGQVGRGEEEQVQGEQAALAVLLEHGRGEQEQARGQQVALAVLLEHGRGGGQLWRTPMPKWSGWPWKWRWRSSRRRRWSCLRRTWRSRRVAVPGPPLDSPPTPTGGRLEKDTGRLATIQDGWSPSPGRKHR